MKNGWARAIATIAVWGICGIAVSLGHSGWIFVLPLVATAIIWAD